MRVWFCVRSDGVGLGRDVGSDDCERVFDGLGSEQRSPSRQDRGLALASAVIEYLEKIC